MELLDRAPTPPSGGEAPSRRSPDDERPGLQQRLERSPAGRLVLSLLVALLVGGVLAWNLPPSHLRDAVMPVVQPVVAGVGLDQRWNLFAPNPPQRTYEVLARITYADGTLALWEPPANDRWRKWLGVVRTRQNRVLWAPTAAWIARHHDGAERGAVRVDLIRRSRDLPPPGNQAIRFPWQEEVFFTYDVPPGDRR